MSPFFPVYFCLLLCVRVRAHFLDGVVKLRTFSFGSGIQDQLSDPHPCSPHLYTFFSFRTPLTLPLLPALLAQQESLEKEAWVLFSVPVPAPHTPSLSPGFLKPIHVPLSACFQAPISALFGLCGSSRGWKGARFTWRSFPVKAECNNYYDIWAPTFSFNHVLCFFFLLILRFCVSGSLSGSIKTKPKKVISTKTNL